MLMGSSNVHLKIETYHIVSPCLVRICNVKCKTWLGANISNHTMQVNIWISSANWLRTCIVRFETYFGNFSHTIKHSRIYCIILIRYLISPRYKAVKIMCCRACKIWDQLHILKNSNIFSEVYGGNCQQLHTTSYFHCT